MRREISKHGTEQKSSNNLQSATADKRREVWSLKEVAGMVRKRVQKKRRICALKKITNLLSEHSPAEWPSLLEDVREITGPVMRDLYLVFTFEPLHAFYLGVFKLL